MFKVQRCTLHPELFLADRWKLPAERLRSSLSSMLDKIETLFYLLKYLERGKTVKHFTKNEVKG